MKDVLEQKIADACQALFAVGAKIELTRPEEQFGDFATNIALQLSKQLAKNSREIGETLAAKLHETLAEQVAEVSVAGPGFINLKLTDTALSEALQAKPAQPLVDQTIVIEHTDANPFKAFHIGHAYSNTIGVSVGLLLQAAGATVHQVSYHGDVGMHIAMAVWALKKAYDKNPAILDDNQQLTGARLATWLGQFYAEGATAYKDNTTAKEQIESTNKLIYNQQDQDVNKLYEWGKARSFKYFGFLYDELSYDDGQQRIEVAFEKEYMESQTGVIGKQVVQEHVGSIFKKSDGAIVYEGEKVGLHTRVFINSQDLPTYEAKEIGLVLEKQKDYPDAQQFIVITANEIDEYFRVMKAAITEIDAELGDKLRHVSHGVVRLSSGKMSSR
ncbi:MAG: arginine--tRNA ligase, partial [Patescibacteria group bacterium]